MTLYFKKYFNKKRQVWKAIELCLTKKGETTDYDVILEINKDLVKSYNAAAMVALREKRFENAKDLLQKAFLFSGEDPESFFLSFNNYSCYLNAIKQTRNALSTIIDLQSIESLRVINGSGSAGHLPSLLLNESSIHAERKEYNCNKIRPSDAYFHGSAGNC